MSPTPVGKADFLYVVSNTKPVQNHPGFRPGFIQNHTNY